jgi:hypothetical protein
MQMDGNGLAGQYKRRKPLLSRKPLVVLHPEVTKKKPSSVAAPVPPTLPTSETQQQVHRPKRKGRDAESTKKQKKAHIIQLISEGRLSLIKELFGENVYKKALLYIVKQWPVWRECFEKAKLHRQEKRRREMHDRNVEAAPVKRSRSTPSVPVITPEQRSSTITPEQRKRIEANRLAALKKLLAKKAAQRPPAYTKRVGSNRTVSARPTHSSSALVGEFQQTSRQHMNRQRAKFQQQQQRQFQQQQQQRQHQHLSLLQRQRLLYSEETPQSPPPPAILTSTSTSTSSVGYDSSTSTLEVCRQYCTQPIPFDRRHIH